MKDFLKSGSVEARRAGRLLSCALWLLSVACGGRTAIEIDRSSAQDPGGAGGAPSAPSWDQIVWDDEWEEAAVYLWTGSVSDTWAVISATASGTFARDHWDGARFTRTAGEQHQQSFGGEQIWAASSVQAFAGSSQSMQRWFGEAWLDWDDTPACHAVGGSAQDDLWCATETELWRFDGAHWTHQVMAGIRGILARARDDVWVWGERGASHFDGARWTLELPNLVRCVSASEATDVWAVQDGNLLHSAGPGGPWTRQNPTGSQIAAVWSQSKDNTFIVAAGAAMRWNGSTWDLVPLPMEDERLLISGSSEDIWIAGTLKLIHGHPVRR